MKLWECPKCKRTMEALAVDVGHRCPSHGRRWVRWAVVEDEADEAVPDAVG